MLGVNVQAWVQVYAIGRTHVHLEALEGQTHACLYRAPMLHGGATGVINTRHQSCPHHTSQTLNALNIKQKYIKKKKKKKKKKPQFNFFLFYFTKRFFPHLPKTLG